MPEKTKRNKDSEKTAEKQAAELPAESCETVVKDNRSADRKQNSYYYDDSYGYEIYNPEEDEEEED